MGVIMPTRLFLGCVPATCFVIMVVVMMIVIVLVTVTMLVVMVVTMPVIVIVVVIVAVAVTVFVVVMIVMMIVMMIVTVVMIVVVRRMDIDVELGRRDAAPVDSRDTERESLDAQLLELGPQQFKIQSKVEHRADKHIAADARKTVEVESPGHSAYSKVPATMVVTTSGWIYLRMASSTSSLVTALTMSGKRSR
jgi:hypothetical protein